MALGGCAVANQGIDQGVARAQRRGRGADPDGRCVADIVPGGTFPDYELPDHTSTPRRLSELQGEDPLILTLARGHYCPKEHQQHLELAAFYPKIAVAYTQVVTIATDDHHTLQEFRGVGRRPVDLPLRSGAERCRRTSTSRSTPTPSTTR